MHGNKKSSQLRQQEREAACSHLGEAEMGQEAESGSKTQSLLNCDIFQGHLTTHELCTSQNSTSLRGIVYIWNTIFCSWHPSTYGHLMMQNTLCPNLKVTIVLIFLHIIKSTKLEVPLEMEDKLLTLSTYKTRVTSTRYDVSPVGQTLPSFRELLITAKVCMPLLQP